MNLENDELVIWEEASNMIINGSFTNGYFFLTNKRMAFVQTHEIRPSFLLRKIKENIDLWEMDIWKVIDLSLMDINGYDHPLVRVRYKESEVFFTFPDLDPKPAYAAMVVFLNHARLIHKNMDLLKNINENLKSGKLEVGERMPRMVIDQPMRTDESCHQCAKTMLEEETNILSTEIRECLMCPE